MLAKIISTIAVIGVLFGSFFYAWFSFTTLPDNIRMDFIAPFVIIVVLSTFGLFLTTLFITCKIWAKPNTSKEK
jgi:hypothetical protein